MRKDQKGAQETLVRSFSAPIQKRTDGEEGEEKEIYSFKLSSEEPAEMWSGIFETMGHKEDEADLNWFKSGNAPLLWMHDREKQIGVITDARLVKGALEVDSKFGTSKLAKQIKADVDAGIIKNVSIGYRVKAWQFEEKDEEAGTENWRATSWEGLEGSFVTIPADKTVGIGRSAPSPAEILSNPQEEPSRSQQIKTMPKEATITQADLDKKRAEGAEHERNRISEINRLAENTKGFDLKDLARTALEGGHDINQFRAEVMDYMQKNAPKFNQAELGIDGKDREKFSLERAMHGAAQGDMEKHAPHEFEVSEALKKMHGREGKGIVIPRDALLRGWTPKDPVRAAAIAGMSARDLQSVTLSGTNQSDNIANIVDTEILDALFQYALTENSAILGMVTTINLVGDAEIPVELLHPSGEWVGEHAEPAQGNYLTGLVDLKFKTYAMRVPYTYRAKVQSTPGLEGLLARSLRIQCALERERTIYNGAGTVDGVTGEVIEPVGILNTAGVGSVTTAGTYSREALIALRQAIGTANANAGESVLVMSEWAAGEFANTKTDAGSGLFVANYAGDSQDIIQTSIGQGRITNLLPNTAAGDATSSVLYFKPSAVVLGQWGAMMLDVDDTTDRNKRGMQLRVWDDYDIAIPQPANFAAITDLS